MAGRPDKLGLAIKHDLLTTLREKNFNPAASMIEIHLEAKKRYEEILKKKTNGFGAASYLGIMARTGEVLMEYVYPKLQRTELTGENGQDIFKSFTDMMKQIALAKNETKKLE